MASPTSTFASLRALHLVISDALDDIQRVFSQNSLPDTPSSPASQCSFPSDPSPATTPPTSFPPTPLSATFPPLSLDYPSPDLPYVSDSLAEQVALHPDAVAAASRIVAACGQISNIVHKPFSSLCDATMSYNLPACIRLVEHLHIAEIIREAEENRPRINISAQGAKLDPNGETSEPVSNLLTRDLVDVRTPINGIDWTPGSRPYGVHVVDITNVICSYTGDGYVDTTDLVHVLRLLSTHHIFRETSPDTFALTRVASLLDSGKSVKAVFSNPETKYDDTDGTSAFVALNTDELFKSAAYLTEAFTGIQLPTPTPASNTRFPVNGRTTTIPAISRCDHTPCTPITRSSSVLTHILYPEDGDVQPHSHSIPLSESFDRAGSLSLSTDIPIPLPFQPLATEPEVLSPCMNPNAASMQVEKTRLCSGTTTKPEKLLAFNLAFHTNKPFFEWLEDGGEDLLGGTGQGAHTCTPTTIGNNIIGDIQPTVLGNEPSCIPRKSFRLERFSNAMRGTTGWEAPKAILSGFDWHSLPKGSTIVDVGGGIGSTTMIIAHALNDSRVDSVNRQDRADKEQPATQHHTAKLLTDASLTVGDQPQNNIPAKDHMNLRFVVQDRPVVTALGVEAWRSKCPEMLESKQVVFQDQDFFEPQQPLEPPRLSRYPAVYLLRVVLHDWPDEFARRILINLRVASNPETRLLIAEHVLPLACVDEDVSDNMDAETYKRNSTDEWTINSVLAHIQGAERTLVPPPLLSNLGKASANAYWMDLIMHITLNGKERTLREFCALALSAGWRISRMTRPEGSLFAYLACEPIPLPDDAQAIYNAIALSSELSTVFAVPSDEPMHQSLVADASRYKRLPAVPLLPSPVLERSASRCGTPTFGSRIRLPRDEELQSPRTRGAGVARKWLKSKGLGVRSVMMQRAEKQKEEQNLSTSPSPQNNGDVPSDVPASSSPVRVWWKKSPPNSTSNSSTTIHELSGEVPLHRTAGRGRRGTLKSSDSPSTPSPRTSAVHQKWPSIESAVLPIPEASPSVPHPRRPSVASITRKLSFATFRRPSVADITEPLPTPPPSATLTELAPPPTLHGDTGRRLRHLPSLPSLSRSEVPSSTSAGLPPIPRRPSLSFAGHHVPQSPQPILKAVPARRPDIADSPKSGILKSRSSPYTYTNKQSHPHPNTRRSTEPTTPSVPRRQRRVTLSNTLPPRMQIPTAGGVNVPPDPAGSEAKRIPSMPKMPRRLSIPMLRRKQGQVQDAGNEG